MSNLKQTLYRMAAGRDVALKGPVPVSWPELLGYLWQRGGVSRLRGLWRGWRLGACGGRLFLGARVRIVFPRHVHVGRNVMIGDDTYISGLSTQGVRFEDDVRIREGGWIQATSVLDEPGVGVTIGRGTYIGPRVVLGAGGGIRIGAGVLFGANVQLLAENHAIDDVARPINEQGVTRNGIAVGDNAWIGNGAILLDGVTVGEGAVVAAGCVVTRDVPARAIAAGNPARVIRHRDEAARS